MKSFGRLPLKSLLLLTAALIGSSANRAISQDQLAEQTNESAVAATVDGDPVYVSEVDRQVANVIDGREVNPQAKKQIQATALEQLIGRRIILRYLAERKLAASEQDLKLELERITQQLAKQELTLDDYLQRSGLTEPELRHVLQWQIGWRRYLDRYVTEENLQTHFERNRRHYDGTQLRVAQILFKVKADGGDDVLEQAQQRAAAIRREIDSGDITFPEAAKRHTDAPSADKGGDIGFISRHEPMPEPFSKVAFDLKEGEVSQPVVSPFGVHLIQCLEVKPGQRRWQDVRTELEEGVTQYLFEWVVKRQRSNAQIEYTGNSPHFKPGTVELAD